MAKPLVRLTKKEVTFVWDKECQESFQNLKEALVSPVILANPRDHGAFILDTDATDSAVGTVLSQIQEGEEQVISYWCRMLYRAESNYCVIDKEFLAIRYFTEYYRQYLL